MSKAFLKNYRQSPRKVRLVVDTVRGAKVDDAITKLMFVPKRAADPIRKLIESAVANAVNNEGLKREELYIKEITADKGITLYRRRARARGRAMPIRKRTSQVSVVLAVKGDKDAAKKEAKKASAKVPVKAEAKVPAKAATKAKKSASKPAAKKASAKKPATKAKKVNKKK